MIETIIATGLIAMILLVIAFKLEDKHQVLKAFSLFFAIFVILMLGKFSLDSKEVCYRELSDRFDFYAYGNNFSDATNSADHWSSGTKPTTADLRAIGNIALFHLNTTYHYHDVCYNVTNSNTPQTVYTASLWYFRIAFIYVFGFIIYLAYKLLEGLIKK